MVAVNYQNTLRLEPGSDSQVCTTSLTSQVCDKVSEVIGTIDVPITDRVSVAMVTSARAPAEEAHQIKRQCSYGV